MNVHEKLGLIVLHVYHFGQMTMKKHEDWRLFLLMMLTKKNFVLASFVFVVVEGMMVLIIHTSGVHPKISTWCVFIT